MAATGRIQPFLPRGTFQASIALCETLDSRHRTVQSRTARVCSQSLTIGCERSRQLLTNPHFSPRGGQIGRRRRFFLYEAETLANAGFDASIRLLQERSPSPRCARFCNLLTNPHHAPQPSLLLGFLLLQLRHCAPDLAAQVQKGPSVAWRAGNGHEQVP